jgi:hypothetical protein
VIAASVAASELGWQARLECGAPISSARSGRHRSIGTLPKKEEEEEEEEEEEISAGRGHGKGATLGIAAVRDCLPV